MIYLVHASEGTSSTAALVVLEVESKGRVLADMLRVALPHSRLAPPELSRLAPPRSASLRLAPPRSASLRLTALLCPARALPHRALPHPVPPLGCPCFGFDR